MLLYSKVLFDHSRQNTHHEQSPFLTTIATLPLGEWRFAHHDAMRCIEDTGCFLCTSAYTSFSVEDSTWIAVRRSEQGYEVKVLARYDYPRDFPGDNLLYDSYVTKIDTVASYLP